KSVSRATFVTPTNGEEALSFLRKASPYQHARTPQLVVPDLNVPTRAGWYVLAERRSDSVLRDLSFVVMSTAPASRNEAVEGRLDQEQPRTAFSISTLQHSRSRTETMSSSLTGDVKWNVDPSP